MYLIQSWLKYINQLAAVCHKEDSQVVDSQAVTSDKAEKPVDKKDHKLMKLIELNL